MALLIGLIAIVAGFVAVRYGVLAIIAGFTAIMTFFGIKRD